MQINNKQKKSEINIRTVINLPGGTGKKIKIAVVSEDAKIQDAKDSGADLYNSESLIKDITEGKINFDSLVATPAMMPKMGIALANWLSLNGAGFIVLLTRRKEIKESELRGKE